MERLFHTYLSMILVRRDTQKSFERFIYGKDIQFKGSVKIDRVITSGISPYSDFRPSIIIFLPVDVSDHGSSPRVPLLRR